MTARPGWGRGVAVALAAWGAAAGCRAAGEACAAATPPLLLGSWTYRATQTSPTAASLGGVLEITSQCGGTIGGTLDVTEVDAQGASRRLTGAVSGAVADSGVDFDAYLDTTPRRHVGTVRGDSLRGTWLEPGDAATLSGSFTAARSAGP
jgi:hypothetical protein